MRRVVGWVLLVGLVLVLGAAAWTASRGWVAWSALQRVRDEVPAITAAVVRADPEALAASTRRVQADADRAVEATDDPLWRLASRLPLGENLAALSTASVAVDRLADDGLPGLQRVVGGVDEARSSLTSGEGLDLPALRGALDGLGDVTAASDAARERLGEIQGDHLLPEVRAARDDLQAQLDLGARAQELIGGLDLPGAGLLAGLAGDDGAASWLDRLPGADDPPSADDLPSVDDLPGVGDLPGLDDLPETDDLPGLDDLPGREDLPDVGGLLDRAVEGVAGR
ncbi:hypothetical protein [uncultured Pseudokineococcus sp.]|uniref:hypothetical protein n=1 Tax=uncultured Pseudokineococcus sp. TaxID=1642928 RepID=UPI002601A596|nr:hypothetical protein [uncultured Pseudokineococcus sp.]